MTAIDERARAAAADLRARAAEHPLPDLGERIRPSSPPRWLPAAAAAVIVVVIGAIALWAPNRDGDVDVVAAPTVSAPAGVDGVAWTPGVLGLTVQVPDDWRAGGPRSGFAHSISGDPMDAYVLATVVPDLPGRQLGDFAAARRTQMAAELDLDVGGWADAIVDGRPASVWDYRLRVDGQEAAVTEYIVDAGGQDRLVVVVGELTPVENGDVRAWIGSTIEVRPGTVPVAVVDHPEPGDPPAGVEPVSWAPPLVGVAMDLPEDWTPGAPFETSVPYAMRAPGEGPRPFVLVSRLQALAGSPAARAVARESEGGLLEASAEVVVDERPATVSRWRMPVDGVAAAVQVEYVIALEDGSYAVVTIGYPRTVTNEVADWVRSTFRITG